MLAARVECRNSIWTMLFSLDRKYLATGGEDGIINIWKVRKVTKDEWQEKKDSRIFEDQPIRTFKGHTVELGQTRNE